MGYRLYAMRNKSLVVFILRSTVALVLIFHTMVIAKNNEPMSLWHHGSNDITLREPVDDHSLTVNRDSDLCGNMFSEKEFLCCNSVLSLSSLPILFVNLNKVAEIRVPFLAFQNPLLIGYHSRHLRPPIFLIV